VSISNSNRHTGKKRPIGARGNAHSLRKQAFGLPQGADLRAPLPRLEGETTASQAVCAPA